MRTKLLFSLIMVMLVVGAKSQSSFNAFHYQAVLKQPGGMPYVNATLNVKIEIHYSSSTGTLLYDEQQSVTTNGTGYVSLNVGNGIPLLTGLYADLTDIPFTDTLYFFNLYVFNSSTSIYDLVSSRPMYSTPFSLYSQNTAQKYNLSSLQDVDTTGIVNGNILKWNGAKWIVSVDSLVADTVSFSFASAHAAAADTATYAITAQNILPSDTANYAYNAGTAAYANNAAHATLADSAQHANVADTALFAAGMWSTMGNGGTNPATDFVGTTDLEDINFVTNNQNRVTIKSDGKVGIGTTTPATDVHIIGDNGLILEGTLGTGAIPATGAGTRFMWYPKKAAFRGGTLDASFSTNWDDAKIANYSFSFGRNTRAEGQCAVSFGENSNATAPWSMAVGFGCNTNAAAQYSFAAGHSSNCNGLYTVALGRGNTATGTASTAIGYHTTTLGNYSRAFGFYCSANADYSTAMGYQANANHVGAFIYIDNSNIPPFINTTAANQFLVRAAGGYLFYTNSGMTTGVTLASGSGSWATLSDSTKKENFKTTNGTEILEKLNKIEVYTWNYKSQDKSIRHIGPTAQQFHKVFGYGENDTTISTVDIDGVNLAAIKALQEKNKLLEDKVKNYDVLLKELQDLKAEREKFILKLNEIDRLMQIQHPETVSNSNQK